MHGGKIEVVLAFEVVHHVGLKTVLGVDISSAGYAHAFKEMFFDESLPKKYFIYLVFVLKPRN